METAAEYSLLAPLSRSSIRLTKGEKDAYKLFVVDKNFPEDPSIWLPPADIIFNIYFCRMGLIPSLEKDHFRPEFADWELSRIGLDENGASIANTPVNEKQFRNKI